MVDVTPSMSNPLSRMVTVIAPIIPAKTFDFVPPKMDIPPKTVANITSIPAPVPTVLATFAVRNVWKTPAIPTPSPANKNESYNVFVLLIPVCSAHFSLPPMNLSFLPIAVRWYRTKHRMK